MSFSDEMRDVDDAYEETEAAEDTGGRLPDGSGQAQLVELRVEENEHGWALVARFRNVHGSIRRWWTLPPTANQLPYFKKDMLLLGYDGKPSGLEAWCETEEALFKICHIGVRTKPGEERDFTDVFLNGTSGEKAAEDAWQQLTEWEPRRESGRGSKRPSGSSGSNQFVPSGSDPDFEADDDIPF